MAVGGDPPTQQEQRTSSSYLFPHRTCVFSIFQRKILMKSGGEMILETVGNTEWMDGKSKRAS